MHLSMIFVHTTYSYRRKEKKKSANACSFMRRFLKALDCAVQILENDFKTLE